MIAPARIAAFHALRAMSSRAVDLGTALEHARETLVDPRDRALATDMVVGVQRWRGAIDHLIAVLADRTIARLDPEVVDILRVSAYQLLYLTRVPAAAVVDDAVSLTGRVGKASARGFVNAVLRSLSRRRAALPLPERPANADDRAAVLAYLTITLSHPAWLVERWLDRYGFDDTERWLRFNNTPPTSTLRVNRWQTTRDALRAELEGRGIPVEDGRFAPDCLLIGRGHAEELGELRGAFVVQDEASQLVTLLAGVSPGHRVLDTCASPGGKTTALAASMAAAFRADADARHPMLVACDVRARRIDLLRRAIHQTGVPHVQIVQADLEHPLPFGRVFDCVFVDVPCSGLGTLRRDPDIKWRRHASDPATLAVSQRRMVSHAAEVLSDGGRLVYATCSSEPEENEAVVAALLEEGGFEQISARGAHPLLPDAVIDTDGALRTLPHRHQLEAFFGVILRRRRQL